MIRLFRDARMNPSPATSSSAAGHNAVRRRPRFALVAAAIAIVFGVLSLMFGGRALFGGAEARAEMGNVVPFVLWFNFLCGFLYILAGIGLILWRRWGALLSAGIAAATLLVFAAFGWHIASGGAFEMRTVGAMILRTGIWFAIAVPACRALARPGPAGGP
jgi:hypothetical protein